MFKILIDPCVWLNFAKDYQGRACFEFQRDSSGRSKCQSSCLEQSSMSFVYGGLGTVLVQWLTEKRRNEFPSARKCLRMKVPPNVSV
jgi:hypothetical protein